MSAREKNTLACSANGECENESEIHDIMSAKEMEELSCERDEG